MSFAKGFDITKNENYTKIKVYNPWQKSSDVVFSYILTDSPETLPDSLADYPLIRIPVRRVVTFSTSHVGFIAALHKSASICGVSGKDFINDSTVRQSLSDGACFDIGFAPNIDFERILSLNPDVVFLYGLDPSVTALVKRLNDANIPSVLVSEFLEEHPLGKAEWIRFFAAFFDCSPAGDSIYRGVEKNYIALRDSAAQIQDAPKILAGLPWKDTWYMAGGKSFTSKLITDAGGDYLWNDNDNTDFIPLDLESVFVKGANADIWINTGTAGSMREILTFDSRFQYFPAFTEGKVYNQNKRLNSSGGNDFWESGAVRPDLILKDLIQIFHSGDADSESLYYYQKLK